MRITEARLKKIIREEVEAKLILEALEQELLSEGLVSFIKKHLGGSKGWKDHKSKGHNLLKYHKVLRVPQIAIVPPLRL